MHGSTQQQISSNRSGYALGVRGLRRLTLSESPVPVFGINHDMKSLFSMRTWTSEPFCRPSKKDGRPSAPSDASRGVSEISPRAGRRLAHVPNAPPSVVEARPNRNAIGGSQEQQRGDYRRVGGRNRHFLWLLTACFYSKELKVVTTDIRAPRELAG